MVKLLVLTDSQVKDLLSMDDAIAAIEVAFASFASGDVSMPSKVYLQFPEFDGDLRIMPASVASEFAGVKVVNSHPRNPSHGLPTVIGTFLLVKQSTGVPIALMNATSLTAIRTGAASAVATRYLAKKGSSSVGLIGAGVQAEYQLQAISRVVDCDEVLVWSPLTDTARRDQFVERMSKDFPSTSFKAVDAIADAVHADIVCTTTPSRVPIISNSDVPEGTHINAVGADGPGKQELDPEILRRADVFVDEFEQAIHGGEINVPIAKGDFTVDQIAGSLADLVSGKKIGRSADDRVTVFDSTGLAMEDLAVATVVYGKALETGIGNHIEL